MRQSRSLRQPWLVRSATGALGVAIAIFAIFPARCAAAPAWVLNGAGPAATLTQTQIGKGQGPSTITIACHEGDVGRMNIVSAGDDPEISFFAGPDAMVERLQMQPIHATLRAGGRIVWQSADGDIAVGGQWEIDYRISVAVPVRALQRQIGGPEIGVSLDLGPAYAAFDLDGGPAGPDFPTLFAALKKACAG